MTNGERIQNYRDTIDSLKRILKNTSWRDSDVINEIRHEIEEADDWICALSQYPLDEPSPAIIIKH
jgi:hypothetical protein